MRLKRPETHKLYLMCESCRLEKVNIDNFRN
jgi:hypothetical protein